MKKMKLIFTATVFFVLLLPFTLQAQTDSLLESLESELPPKEVFEASTFKATRLINLHTVETLGEGILDFRVSHRFGDFSSGIQNLYGLDGPATIRIGFDYAVSDRLMIGGGRTSYAKMYDVFLKYKLLRQTVGNAMPITVTWLSSANITTVNDPLKALGVDNLTARLAYFHELMIARKMGEKLSLQIAPIFVHYNVVKQTDRNNLFAVAFSGRYKISRSMAITGEYALRAINYKTDLSGYTNSAGVGFSLETGGHVFQVFVSNSFAINQVQVVPHTTSSWKKGQIRLGFNISRVFALKRKTTWE